MIEGPIDLSSLDVLVARTHELVKRDRAHLASEDGRATARMISPFAGLRDASAQSTFQGLQKLRPSQAHLTHRDGLVRWVHELLQERVAWDLTVDEMDAVHATDASASYAIRREKAASRPIADDGEHEGPSLRRLTTFDEARCALVDATSADRGERATDIALGRLAALAPPVVAVRRELRVRRFEAARRLGLEHPWALAVPGPVSVVADLARALLDATEPLAVELHKSVARRDGLPASPSRTIHDSFARDAREGWPAHLTVRWLEETFRTVAPRPFRMTSLPQPIGGASFLRAVHDWGFGLRLSGVMRTLPFALARDPYPVDAYVFGSAFAIAVADRTFARRKLGLAARLADIHGRALARSLFVALRTLAAGLLVEMSSSTRDDELEELTARVFGAPLGSNLAAVWSYGGFSGSSRVDAPARLLGAVRAHGMVRGLVDRFDEDWFDNPRVAHHLASISAGQVWNHEAGGADFGAAELGAVSSIARSFEEALG